MDFVLCFDPVRSWFIVGAGIFAAIGCKKRIFFIPLCPAPSLLWQRCLGRYDLDVNDDTLGGASSGSSWICLFFYCAGDVAFLWNGLRQRCCTMVQLGFCIPATL